ncbi:hypothetical protein [Streptomyces sp. NPDC058678]|uniref:hypothetical protein n=1 Tax=Streptomyces sp. NPDC058678 TaxID=3346595 RepID=UPI00364C83AB
MASNSETSEGSYAATLQKLGEALTDLKRERGAPSYDRILVHGKKMCGERAAMSKASMSEVFAGRRGPASWDRLLWLVRALLSYDDGEEVKPPDRRDPQLQVWRDRWHALESERAAARSVSSTQDLGQVPTADRDPAATSSRQESIAPNPDVTPEVKRFHNPGDAAAQTDPQNPYAPSAEQPAGQAQSAREPADPLAGIQKLLESGEPIHPEELTFMYRYAESIRDETNASLVPERETPAEQGRGQKGSRRPVDNGADSSLQRDRCGKFLKIGRDSGLKLTLIPKDDDLTSIKRIDEFLDSLSALDFTQRQIEPFHALRRKVSAAQSPEEFRALVYEHAAAMDDVAEIVHSKATGGEYGWFLIGHHMYSVAYIATSLWPDSEIEKHVAELRRGLAYLTEALDIPKTLRDGLKDYCSMPLPAKSQNEVFNEADRLYRACYVFLGSGRHTK